MIRAVGTTWASSEGGKEMEMPYRERGTFNDQMNRPARQHRPRIAGSKE